VFNERERQRYSFTNETNGRNALFPRALDSPSQKTDIFDSLATTQISGALFCRRAAPIRFARKNNPKLPATPHACDNGNKVVNHVDV
jgi:hypothetical protein